MMSERLRDRAAIALGGLPEQPVRRGLRVQIAALCLRPGSSGGVEVLLVTSRGTGRWLLPKGWPEPGHDGAGTAALEAWEEAGLRDAHAAPEPVAEYQGVKRHDSGIEEAVRVEVYVLEGGRLAQTWPEKGQRRRAWLSPREAAARVREAGLRTLLQSL